jgi:hypothetical protein
MTSLRSQRGLLRKGVLIHSIDASLSRRISTIQKISILFQQRRYKHQTLYESFQQACSTYKDSYIFGVPPVTVSTTSSSSVSSQVSTSTAQDYQFMTYQDFHRSVQRVQTILATQLRIGTAAHCSQNSFKVLVLVEQNSIEIAAVIFASLSLHAQVIPM